MKYRISLVAAVLVCCMALIASSAGDADRGTVRRVLKGGWDMVARTAPATPPTGKGRVYYSSADKSLHVIDDTGSDVALGGGASAASLASTLAVGNTTGGTDILLTSADVIRPVSNAGADLGTTGQNFNELYLATAIHIDNQAYMTDALLRGHDSTTGGAYTLRAGDGTTGNGGKLTLAGGDSGSGTPGSIWMETGGALRWAVDSAGDMISPGSPTIRGGGNIFLEGNSGGVYLDGDNAVYIRTDNLGTFQEKWRFEQSGLLTPRNGSHDIGTVSLPVGTIYPTGMTTTAQDVVGAINELAASTAPVPSLATVMAVGNATGDLDIVSATVGGSDLGSTTAEWGNIYVGNLKYIYFGDSQEAYSQWAINQWETYANGILLLRTGGNSGAKPVQLQTGGGSQSSAIELLTGTASGTAGAITLGTDGNVRWTVEDDGDLSSSGHAIVGARRDFENIAGNDTLTTSESGKLVTNSGASGTVTYTLPAGANGVTYTVVRVATQEIHLDPDGTETITYSGGTVVSGEVLKMQSDGAKVRITWIGSTWLVELEQGTLVDEAP